MSFLSLRYFLFLPGVLLLCHVLPRRLKNPAMLAASYLFYMGWSPAHALLMLLSTVTTYFAARCMGLSGGRYRKLCLAGTLIVNFGILFLFKYFDFFAGALDGLLALLGRTGPGVRLSPVLPVGISFFTFQAAGYLIDVYRGEQPAERNFVDYALFVSFFPQIAAGPIGRAGSLLPQLKQDRAFSDEDLKAGTLRVLWGILKKLVIADQLAVVVNTAFADVSACGGVQLLLAAFCFTFQIYCDFSAYSDIACGSARILGIHLMENFRNPYGAESLREFWRRWHISLSTWFQDYLYIPLGGSRVGKCRHCLNLLIVFAVSGLWHGAAGTYLIWGLLHGLARVCGILLAPIRERIYRVLPRRHPLMRVAAWLGTFLFVTLTWIFFRAETPGDALTVLVRIAEIPTQFVWPSLAALGITRRLLGAVAAALVCLWMVDHLREKHDLTAWFCCRDTVRYAAYFGIVVFTLLYGCYGNAFNPQDFVYFRF